MRHTRTLSTLFGLFLVTGCAARDAAPPAQPTPMDAPAMEAPGYAPKSAGAAMAGGADMPGQASPAPPVAGVAASGPQMGHKPKSAHGSKAGPARPAAAKGAKTAAEGDGDKDVSGDHMLIFTGGMNLEVDKGDIAKSIDEVVDQAVLVGGYVHKQTDTSVTVRVPSKSFRRAMRKMEKIGDVMHRSVQAEDVSEEFHDLGIRLKSLKATRARLEKFLDRAKTMAEVLNVERELTRLNGQIDKIEGRMRFLSQRAAMSTITVTFQAKPEAKKVIVKKAPPVPPPPEPPKPKTRSLPIEWLHKVGLDNLLNLR